MADRGEELTFAGTTNLDRLTEIPTTGGGQQVAGRSAAP